MEKKTNFKKTKGSNLGECRAGNKSLVSCLPEVYPMYNIFFSGNVDICIWLQWLAGALSPGCSYERLLDGRF